MHADLPVRVVDVDFANPQHAADLVSLLDAYAQDPAGGGEALSDYARQHLAQALAARSAGVSPGRKRATQAWHSSPVPRLRRDRA